MDDYWKETRLNYDNVVLSNLTMQSNYMADIANGNCNIVENPDADPTNQLLLYHYWSGFAYILDTFNEGVCTGFPHIKNIERERMKGMLDAMNTIIEMIKKGEFME